MISTPYQIDDFVRYSLIYNFCLLHYYLSSISYVYVCVPLLQRLERQLPVSRSLVSVADRDDVTVCG